MADTHRKKENVFFRLRLRRNRLWLIPVVLLVVIVIAVFCMRITTVNIEGNSFYTDEQIEERIFSGKYDRLSVVFWWKNRFQSHVTIPFVERYDISFSNFHTLRVIVYEKNITGCIVYLGDYVYFDRDGTVVDSSSKKLDGIPLISGLAFQSCVIGQTLPVEDSTVFKDIMTLSQQIQKKNIDVDKIELASLTDIVLYIDDLTIKLGNDEYLEGKIAILSDILPSLEGRKGTLYLDTYTDTAFNYSYVFKPSE